MTPDGLVPQLAELAAQVLVARCGAHADRSGRAALGGDLMTPRPIRGPTFGSYASDDVAWLLTDLSEAVLEAPVEEREEAIQAGGAHYAESLPIEYQARRGVHRPLRAGAGGPGAAGRRGGRARHGAGAARSRRARRPRVAGPRRHPGGGC